MIHIMMATYNGEKFIKEQINSILAQTYTEWKLYISDDGSTDRTISIVKQYKQDYPDKIFLVDHSAEFHSAKRNFAFLYSVVPLAEYYAFCDQDDIWEENKLACMLECIKNYDINEPVLVYHDMTVGTDRQKIFAQSFIEYSGLKLNTENSLQQILLYNVVPGCTMMLNNMLKQLVDEISEACVMHDWWIMLATISLGGKVICCDKKLSLYRQHGQNQIGAVKQKSLFEMMVKCLDFVRLDYYIKNNRKIKMERIQKTKAILDCYEDQIDRKNIHLLKHFLYLLTSKRRLYACSSALKNNYIFFNKLYTIKLFLL